MQTFFVGVARLIGTYEFSTNLTPELKDFLGFDVLIYLDRKRRHIEPVPFNKTLLGLTLEPECQAAPGKAPSRAEVAWSYHVTIQVCFLCS